MQQNQPSFSDIVNAQQQLNTFLAAYLTALQAQWQAVVDLAALGQLDDLYLPVGQSVGPVCSPLALPARPAAKASNLPLLPAPAPVPPAVEILTPPAFGDDLPPAKLER